jgi:RNA polymerase II transcription elongation factor
VDPSLKLPSSVKAAHVTRTGSSSSGSASLHLEGTKPFEKYSYRGTASSSQGIALFFNPSTQTFTLDTIDDDLHFNAQEDAPSDDQSGDELISRIKAQHGDADPENPSFSS